MLDEVLMPPDMLVVVLHAFVARQVCYPLLTIGAAKLHDGVVAELGRRCTFFSIDARLGPHSKSAVHSLSPTLIVVPILYFVDIALAMLRRVALLLYLERGSGKALAANADLLRVNPPHCCLLRVTCVQ